MAQDDEILTRLEGLEVNIAQLASRLAAVPGGQCNSKSPHPNQLVYMRGPNHYACQCGKIYKKDGAGGLMDGN